MKLRNKKTGAIYNIEDIDLGNNEDGIWVGLTRYKSLAEFNEEWEDYDNTKDSWCISYIGTVKQYKEYVTGTDVELCKQIGNCFNTREEAEKAVEKLKAFKRLKDKGFRFRGWTIDDGLRISISTNTDEDDVYDDDKRKIKPYLDLVFGGEE